jgi:hypothetical protein
VEDRPKNADIKKQALIDAALYFVIFFILNLLFFHWRPMPITKTLVVSAGFAGLMYVRKRKDWFD